MHWIIVQHFTQVMPVITIRGIMYPEDDISGEFPYILFDVKTNNNTGRR
ncbi:MAG: hypothetical protein K9N46_03040 [Candidatus Marinimicrobia bacterium]|nr:hypothetical protein [Candidatus Neomarinimicrobiota bacterium]MCF7828127.1 hypothetical protein [Candidatus Neomarinimicrobiota bacterium]MCF7879698.1 hypothetical protein [Candidatus Neomarinimicrobiota bacterium]